MISRREFLRGGTVAGLVSTLPAGAVIAKAHTQPTAVFDAICDTRYEEGDQFLRAVSSSAYRVHGLDVDPGSIMPMIADAVADKRPVAGLTTDAALLLAEQLAGAEGYELAYKGVHKHLSGDQVEHRLLLNNLWQTSIEQPLTDAGAAWPEVIAKLMSSLVTDGAAAEERQISVPSKRHPASPGHLVSWILRPA